MANLRLQSILKNKVEEIVNSRGHQPSIAFICLMLQEIFDLDEFEAEDAITDMAQDKGIDAIFERDEEGDSILYVVQAKYFIQNCNKTIDENSKNLLVSAISNYILSDYPLDNLNAKLKIKLNEYRERISSGKIDQIVMVFIINGQRPGKNIISELDQFKEEQEGQSQDDAQGVVRQKQYCSRQRQRQQVHRQEPVPQSDFQIYLFGVALSFGETASPV